MYDYLTVFMSYPSYCNLSVYLKYYTYLLNWYLKLRKKKKCADLHKTYLYVNDYRLRHPTFAVQRGGGGAVHIQKWDRAKGRL